jgi:hypothetical protein
LGDPLLHNPIPRFEDEILVREASQELDFPARAVSVNKGHILAGWIGLAIPSGIADLKETKQGPAVSSLVEFEAHTVWVAIEHFEGHEVPQGVLLEQTAHSTDVRIHTADWVTKRSS